MPKITKLCLGVEIFWHQNISEKSERKMLMKLTLDGMMIYATIIFGLNPSFAIKILLFLFLQIVMLPNEIMKYNYLFIQTKRLTFTLKSKFLEIRQ